MLESFALLGLNSSCRGHDVDSVFSPGSTGVALVASEPSGAPREVLHFVGGCDCWGRGCCRRDLASSEWMTQHQGQARVSVLSAHVTAALQSSLLKWAETTLWHAVSEIRSLCCFGLFQSRTLLDSTNCTYYVESIDSMHLPRRAVRNSASFGKLKKLREVFLLPCCYDWRCNNSSPSFSMPLPQLCFAYLSLLGQSEPLLGHGITLSQNLVMKLLQSHSGTLQELTGQGLREERLALQMHRATARPEDSPSLHNKS